LKSKLAGIVSACVLSIVFWFIGLVGMVFKALEYLFDKEEDHLAVMAQGGEWIFVTTLGLGLVFLIAAHFARGHETVSRWCRDLSRQCDAILFGGAVALIIATNAWLLAFFAPLYAILHVAWREETHESERVWKAWTLHSLTVLTAAFVVTIAYL
jgi:hypothetical protein